MNELRFAPGERLGVGDLRDAWRILDPAERADGFRLLDPEQVEDFFLSLSPVDQRDLLSGLTKSERRIWMRLLPPDDAADVVQVAEPEERSELLDMLDIPTRREVMALLAYSEDDAGGLMSPRFARVRPEMTVDEAILYLRRQANQNLETIYYGYVLDAEQKLLGVVSFRDLFQAKGQAQVKDIMHGEELVTVPEDMDQELVGRIFARHDLVALPVVDGEGRMQGIVTVDDIVDVVQEEATEDIHKIGGTEALDAPYLDMGLAGMIKKRGGWLTIFFLAQIMTVAAMTFYRETLESAVVLAAFVPLIISSGGNTGSQASTLVIRAMALGEVRLTDWARVLTLELATGLTLGLILALLGFLLSPVPGGGELGSDFVRLGLTVSLSILGVVICGSVLGSMLPMGLRRIGLDPASASGPFVTTMVDVAGLVIYFTFAELLLGSTLLAGTGGQP